MAVYEILNAKKRLILSQRQTTVDGDILAGDERCFVAGEEDNRSRDVVGNAPATGRNRRAVGVLHVLGPTLVALDGNPAG